jgi:hypothetical protein
MTSLALAAAIVSGTDLKVQIRAAKGSFVAGEPIFVTLQVVNNGTNTAAIDLGERLLENILLSTAAEKVQRKSSRLREGGGFARTGSVTIPAGEKYETVLYVGDWLPLGIGKHKLQVKIKGRTDEYTVLADITVTQGSEEALAQALRQSILKVSGEIYSGENEPYIRGLKDACKQPAGKRALLRLRGEMREKQDLKTIEYILENYNHVIYD